MVNFFPSYTPDSNIPNTQPNEDKPLNEIVNQTVHRTLSSTTEENPPKRTLESSEDQEILRVFISDPEKALNPAFISDAIIKAKDDKTIAWLHLILKDVQEEIHLNLKFQEAVLSGDLETTKDLYEQIKEWITPFEFNSNLYKSILNKKVEIVEYFLSLKKPINLWCIENGLKSAIENNDLAMTKTLYNNLKESINSSASSLHFYTAISKGNIEIVEYLLSLKISVESWSIEDGLKSAIENNDLAMTKTLYNNLKESISSSASSLHLYTAISKGNIEIVEYLLSLKISVEPWSIENGLKSAVQKNHIVITEKLYEHFGKLITSLQFHTDLYKAISQGHIETVKYLLSLKRPVNPRCIEDGLKRATQNNDFPMIDILTSFNSS